MNQEISKKLGKEEAKLLFTNIYKVQDEVEQSLLESLLKAVNYKELLINLLAKNMSAFGINSDQKYTLTNLVNDFQKQDVFTFIKPDKTPSLKSASTESIIKAMYEIAGLKGEERSVLSVLAALDKEKISLEDLNILLPNKKELNQTLIILANKGWVESDNTQTNFQCKTPIAQVIRKQNALTFTQDCEGLILSLNRKLLYDKKAKEFKNSNYEKVHSYVKYAEALCDLSELQTSNIGFLMGRVGDYYQVEGNNNRALKFCHSYQKLGKKLVKITPSDLDLKLKLSISCEKLGATYTFLGKVDKALEFYTQGVKILEELHKIQTENTFYKNSLSLAYANLASSYRLLGDLKEAMKFYRRYNKLKKELHEFDKTNPSFHLGLAISYQDIGSIYLAQKDLNNALWYYQKFNEICKELYEFDSNNSSYQNILAISYEKLGDVRVARGKLQEARDLYKKERDLKEDLCGIYPKDMSFKDGLAVSYLKLGETYINLRFFDKGVDFMKKNLQLRIKLYQTESSHLYKNSLAIAYFKLGEAHYVFNKKDEAKSFFDKSQTLWLELIQAVSTYHGVRNNLEEVKRFLKTY